MKLTRRKILLMVLCVVAVLVPAAVVITNAGQPDKPAAPAPRLSTAAFEDQSRRLLSALQQSGAPASFQLVRQNVASDRSFARDCHPLLHRLGHKALEHYGSFTDAMASADEICNSGYVHGLIEANFLAADDVRTAIQTSCPTTEPSAFRRYQCYHGIGHGIMYAEQKNVQASVALCQELPDTSSRSSCVNGVFMEAFVTVDHSGNHVPSGHQDLSLCRDQVIGKADCYVYAPSAFLSHHPDQYMQAVTWCQAAPQANRGNCIRGIGVHAMKDNITRPAVSAGVCTDMAVAQRTACVTGAVSVYIRHHSSTDPARTLCSAEFKAYQRTCLVVVNNARKELAI